MAVKEYTAYEAAKELLDPKNVKSEKVADIGSRYPLFTRMVLTDGTQSLLHILSAIPKATAKAIEEGLRAGKSAESEKEEKAPASAAKAKKPGRPASAAKASKKEDEENPYAGKTAKELYTMCKERGLEVKPKQPASEYAKLLMEDDQDAQDPADPEDDWEEEEAEEKPAKKKAGRPAKKKEEPEPEEEDDDWEI